MTTQPDAPHSPRGRKPTAAMPVEKIEINQDSVDAMNANTALMRTVQANYNEERDLLNQLLGQMQMAEAVSRFSQALGVTKLAHIKENKLYKAMAGVTNARHVTCDGTWDSFCELFGMSRQKADEDIANLKVFGETALESMSRMGIGYRELRQFRRLSEDEKSALAEVARDGDKEAVLDLAEQLIARQRSTNEQLANKLEKKSREYDALSQRQADLSQQLDESIAKSSLLRRMKPDQRAQEMMRELQDLAVSARAHLRPAMRAVEDCNRYLREQGIEDHDAELSALMIEILQIIAAPLGDLDVSGVSEPIAFIKRLA